MMVKAEKYYFFEFVVEKLEVLREQSYFFTLTGYDVMMFRKEVLYEKAFGTL
ncbi:hypothetical protein M2475_000840 [Breznakia sp. PF5-3]|nr:hypothetical protein [Breznakia sp. PF5-3]